MKATKIMLTTLVASSVLGTTGVVKAADEEVVNQPTEEVQPPVVEDKPVVPELPKDDKVEDKEQQKNEIKPKEPEILIQPPVVDDNKEQPKDKIDKDKVESKKDDKAEDKEQPKDEVDKGKVEEKKDENKPDLKPEEEKKAEDNKKNIIETRKDITKNLEDFKNVVEVAKDKVELKTIIDSTDKISESQKQVLIEKLQNSKTPEQIKEVKELAKTGENASILSTVIGGLGIALAGLLRKIK